MQDKIQKKEYTPNPAREALRILSQKIRIHLQKTGSASTINEVLEDLYRKQSGQTDFDTYNGWKNRGYQVNKGAKGYPVWSKPRSAKTDDDATERTERTETPDGVEVSAGKKSPQNFWISYLFHAGQVHDANGNTPTSAGVAPRLALPIPQDYQAELDTINPADAKRNQQAQAQTLDDIFIDEDDEDDEDDIELLDEDAINAKYEAAIEAQAEFVF